MRLLRCFLASLTGALTCAFCLACPTGADGAAPPPPAAPAAFFERHCFECHDADLKKGGLDLTAVLPAFADPEGTRHWTNIYDRIESGEMPPKKKPRPADAEKHAALAWIGGELRGADLSRQKTLGRSMIRRLSRVEYENTVRDLLGTDIDLKEMLPEDGFAHGFDNQDSGLDVSPVLVERYLEAAEAALNAAIVKGPRPQTLKNRYSYLDEAGQISKAYEQDKYIIRLPDAAVFTNKDHPPKILAKFRAPTAGRYRFRISCYTWDNPTRRPLGMLVYSGSQSVREGKTVLSGAFDVPFEPGVVEFTERLEPKDTIRIDVLNIPRQYPKKLTDFKGPGLAVQWVEVEGPLVESWPPAGHRQLLGETDLAKGTLEDAKRIIGAFVPRAFRRPATDAEAAPYVKIVESQLAAGMPFEQALRVGLKAVLCSPQFLYHRAEPGELDDFALASRLSYFLWSSMPDAALLDAAAAGKLREPAALRGQVERMLADPKAERFTREFTGQWLNLRAIDATTPDAKLYPEFDEQLQLSMLQETHRFFDEVLKNDLSLLNFVDSDWAMLNARLAEHYGIPGITGQLLRRVTLPNGSVRGGVMTQAAVLKVTANGTNTSPVTRGVWVMDRILGRPVPPPPQNVPAIEPDVRGATTVRELLTKHASSANCAGCHSKIDPPGYALESFDVVGTYRDNYRILATGFKDRVKGKDGGSYPYAVGPKVEAGATLADGRGFADVAQFKKLLLADPDGIARALAEKLLVYGTGHGLEFADRDEVAKIVERAKAKQYGFRTLVHEVVQSRVFRSK